MRKQALAPRLGGKISQPIHYFKRFLPYQNISSAANTTFTAGSIYIEPNTDIPGWSEFVSLYDSYKIMAMKVMFFPISDNTTSVASQSESFLRIFTAIDYNDRSVPIDVSTLREYDNCKISPNNKVHKRYFKPNFTLDIENTDFTATMPNKYKPWLATNAGNAEHYGLKYAIETQNNTSSVPLYRVEIKVYMAFKAKR